MVHKTYELSCRLSIETAIERIEDLLAKEGVQYRTADLSIASIGTPIALFSFQRILYSSRNWVGLNPFTFVSSVIVRCESSSGGLTRIIIQVNQARTFLWSAFWAWCGALSALGMPEPAGAILFMAVTLAAWFGLVSFLGGALIKKEIGGWLMHNEKTDSPKVVLITLSGAPQSEA